MTFPGRFLGHGFEPWELRAVQGGFRRVFAVTKGNVWDEARVWTASEVAANLAAGVWRRVEGRRL